VFNNFVKFCSSFGKQTLLGFSYMEQNPNSTTDYLIICGCMMQAVQYKCEEDTSWK